LIIVPSETFFRFVRQDIRGINAVHDTAGYNLCTFLYAHSLSLSVVILSFVIFCGQMYYVQRRDLFVQLYNNKSTYFFALKSICCRMIHNKWNKYLCIEGIIMCLFSYNRIFYFSLTNFIVKFVNMCFYSYFPYYYSSIIRNFLWNSTY